MLDDLDQQQTYGLVGGLLIVAAVAFGAGIFYAGGMTGAMTADGASEEEIRTQVQTMMDQQVQQQRQQFALVANQSENITQDDLSISAEVTDISQSDFGSLYEVSVQVTGTVPSQVGGLQDLDETQSMYISQDGRYLFQEPTDLEQQGQQQQPPAPQ